MKIKVLSYAFFIFAFVLPVFGQLNLPRESQRQEIVQTIGDTKITIVYHRPNVKSRTVWGELVPFGEVWRAGANENTTVDFSRDVTINGKPLPAGKYGFHAIPNKDQWVLIFSKVNDAWGSFTYDEKQDALRVTAKPQKADFRETMAFEIDEVSTNTAKVNIVWENLAVPFTVDIGDLHGRTLAQIREAVKNRKPDDVRTLNQAAGYVLTYKLKDNYEEALGWLDASLKARETFGTLNLKARLLAEAGKKAEAIAAAEKAVAIGKSATPPANTADLERLLTEWKTQR